MVIQLSTLTFGVYSHPTSGNRGTECRFQTYYNFFDIGFGQISEKIITEVKLTTHKSGTSKYCSYRHWSKCPSPSTTVLGLYMKL